MIPRVRYRTLYVNQMGPAEPGQWCDRCALPSAVLAHMVVSSEQATLFRRNAYACQDCGECWAEDP